MQTSADAIPSYPPLFSGCIADLTLPASVDEPPNFQAPVTPIVVATYAGAAAATALASGSSGAVACPRPLGRVLELVQFSPFTELPCPHNNNTSSACFKPLHLQVLALSANDVCEICPSRCAQPSAFVIPTFSLVGGTAIFTLILLVFNSFNVDHQTDSAAAQHRFIAEVCGISTAVRTPSRTQRYLALLLRCARGLSACLSSCVLMPSSFVFHFI